MKHLFAILLICMGRFLYAYGNEIPKHDNLDDAHFLRLRKGSVYLVFEVDPKAEKIRLLKESATLIPDLMREEGKREIGSRILCRVESIAEQDALNVIVAIPRHISDPNDRKAYLEKAKDILHELEFFEYPKKLSQTDRMVTYLLRLKKSYRDVIQQALMAFRSHFDVFGVVALIRREPNQPRIIVEFPGVKDSSKILNIIKTMGRLEFRLIAKQPGTGVPWFEGPDLLRKLFSMGLEFHSDLNNKNFSAGLRGEFENNGLTLSQNVAVAIEMKDSRWVIVDVVHNQWYTISKEGNQLSIFLVNEDYPPDNIPKGTEIRYHGETDNWYVLKSRVVLLGHRITDVQPVSNNTNSGYAVSISFDPQGRQKLAKIARDYVGEHLAILSDGKIKSTLIIRDKMGENVQIEGNLSYEAANNLAKTLRLRAFPDGVRIAEERTVGPLLSLDKAIAAYKKAINLKPNSAAAHYHLACAYALKNGKALAIESLQKAIRLDKSYAKKAKTESDLDNIRESREFQELINSVE